MDFDEIQDEQPGILSVQHQSIVQQQPAEPIVDSSA